VSNKKKLNVQIKMSPSQARMRMVCGLPSIVWTRDPDCGVVLRKYAHIPMNATGTMEYRIWPVRYRQNAATTVAQSVATAKRRSQRRRVNRIVWGCGNLRLQVDERQRLSCRPPAKAGSQPASQLSIAGVAVQLQQVVRCWRSASTTRPTSDGCCL